MKRKNSITPHPFLHILMEDSISDISEEFDEITEYAYCNQISVVDYMEAFNDYFLKFPLPQDNNYWK